jgi:hypothetical protein
MLNNAKIKKAFEKIKSLMAGWLQQVRIRHLKYRQNTNSLIHLHHYSKYPGKARSHVRPTVEE